MEKELTKQEKEFIEATSPFVVAADCAICGEKYVAKDFLAICPKCREAILYAKALMDSFLRKSKDYEEDENGGLKD